MNIIHLLSQNHLTGAEVYAVTLGQLQSVYGHKVFQISNGFFYESSIEKIQMDVETNSKVTRLNNILKLRNFIKSNQIQVIHTHSRAAAKLGYWATLGLKTTLVSTVHGIQHSSFSKKLFNQYGQIIISVSENIKKQLISEFKYDANTIKVLPNPISTKDFTFRPETFNRILNRTPKLPLKIALIGRLTGPKRERSQNIINEFFLLSQSEQLKYQLTIIGGSASELEINPSEKSHIQFIEFQKIDSNFLSEFDLVIGSGRVCIEAILSGVPTLAYGEAKFEGLVTLSNYQLIKQSNFGDIYLENPSAKMNEKNKIDFKKIINSIFMNQFNPSDLRQLSEICFIDFNSNDIYTKINRIYESAYFIKQYNKSIPVLMYHKIPDEQIQSQHKIFVTKKKFEQHLKFFKFLNFTTLTFNDLELYRTGKIDFKFFPKKPLILTFDDGYLDNLINASELLKKYSFKAQIYLLADKKINSNIWDTDNSNSSEPQHPILSGEDRLKWLDSAFDIGSHGFHHKKITAMSESEALLELENSKKSLEKEFNKLIYSYAFTYGDTNPQMARLAERAGYSYAVNTDSGDSLIERSPYSIFRVNIFPNENFFSLFKKTSTWYKKYFNWKRRNK